MISLIEPLFSFLSLRIQRAPPLVLSGGMDRCFPDQT
jgi:hypothetical protein